MKTFTFPPAKRGLATEFPASDESALFASKLQNRYINLNGDAERRPGLRSFARAGTATEADTLAEHVTKSGESQLLSFYTLTPTQPKSEGRVYDYLGVGSVVPVQLNNFDLLTLGYGNMLGDTVPNMSKIVTAQMNDKTVVVAKHIRPQFYDSEKGKFLPLNSVLAQGVLGAGSTKSIVVDADISAWNTLTYVAPNDILYNVTRNAFGIVTSVGASNLDITPITSAGDGGRGLGLGLNGEEETQAQGDVYQIWDLVANNVISLSNDIDLKDNVALATTGTTEDIVFVSGAQFVDEKVLPGDFIYNATQNAVMQIEQVFDNYLLVAANNPTYVWSQTAGDSLVFLKNAVPVASYVHVHYGRAYLVDSRDPTKIYPSAPDTLEDFTTFQGTLQASQVNYGAQQPQGEEILTLGSFQRYLVAGGKRNVYVSQGIDPIQDTTAAVTDLAPVGLFTQGVISSKSLANIGSDMLFASKDGLRQFRISDILAVNTDNVSEFIKTELRTAISSNLFDPDTLQVIHYPRRNWVMFKVGDVIYNFNYTAVYDKAQGGLVSGGSWSKFTGTFAQGRDYLLRSDGSILVSVSANVSGLVNDQILQFDAGNDDDAGDPILTDYEASWIGPDGGFIMDTRYIKPYFENITDTNYTMTITSDLETLYLDDTVIVSAAGGPAVGSAIVGSSPVGGTKITNGNKYPFRSRGEQVKIRVTTSAGSAPDILSKFILYGNQFGLK